MKLLSLFRSFLQDTVNLNQTRVDLLESSVDALQKFVKQCEWSPKVLGFEPQGSWAHDTIIKPVDGGEFDADLLVLVEPVEGWSASDYVKKLGEVFASSGTYGDKVKTWDYCVTVTYAGERKVDLAPCVVGRQWAGQLEVCNRSTNKFERSEPTEYTAWLKNRNAISGSNSFRKVTRILKYMRDIKTTFTCPSVLLTTLLGQQINWFDQGSSDFQDTPTTLKTVIGRLDDFLQANPTKPAVTNPKLTTENFADLWTDNQYTNFRNFIHKYRGWVDDAFVAEERSESIRLWRKVLGDDFAKGEAVIASRTVTEGMELAKRFLLSTGAHLNDLVEVVKNFGVSVLPESFYRPSHMQEPPWAAISDVATNVHVSATWHASRNHPSERRVQAHEVLPARGGLWFDVHLNHVQPLPSGFRVQWRITNTGDVAYRKHALRGDFYPPTSGNRRWEDLSYRGVHIAEAFVLRRSDDVLVARSAPFNVIIE